MPPSHADANQVLQRTHVSDRDTLRIDALAWESTDGGTTWIPINNIISDNDFVDAHAYVWNGSSWIEFTG